MTELGQWILSHVNIVGYVVNFKGWAAEINQRVANAKRWSKMMSLILKNTRWGNNRRKKRTDIEGWEYEEFAAKPRISLTTRASDVRWAADDEFDDKGEWKQKRSWWWGWGKGRVSVDDNTRIRPRPELCRRMRKAYHFSLPNYNLLVS